MAKVTDHEEPIPERLARFIPAEWPGTDPAGDWGKEARQWLADHPGRSLPHAGDPLEIRQWVITLRAGLAERGGRAGPPLRRSRRADGVTLEGDAWAGEREDEDGAWHD